MNGRQLYNNGGYLPSRKPKNNFICDNIPTKAILFFFGCSEVNSTWLITSELANQRARKVLFICVVYTKNIYFMDTSVLPENTPLVTFIRNYIQDSSGVFSISSLVKISMMSLISSLSLS